MASSHFGLSRVPRPSNAPVGPEEGPGVGAYQIPGAMDALKPGFTSFGGGKRSGAVARAAADEPGPGAHNLGGSLEINMSTRSGAGGTLKSKTKRLDDEFYDKDIKVGPQSYVLPSSVKAGRPKNFRKPGMNNGLGNMVNVKKSVPSVPTRFQATGYEETDDGNLVLQDPVEPGFAGTKFNSVGPGDYEPKMEFVKYKHAPTVSMKGSDRNQLYRSMEKAGGQAPGPGYYNYRGDFDLYDNSDNTNYIVRLNAAKKKLSASFASGSSRNAMLNAELKPKIGNPGPGAYTLRREDPEMNSPDGKKTDQNFLSGGERFPTEKNQRDTTAPNKVALKSEFDTNKLKILRSKKLKSRSGWAQNISFDATEERFFKATRQETVVPPPGAYTPKTEFKQLLKKSNERAPGFGSSTERDFKESNANKRVMTAQEQLMQELEEDMRHGVGPGGMSAKLRAGGAGSSHGSVGGPSRPAGIGAAFGSGIKEARFGKSLEPVGPPPGAYNTIPSWSGNSVVKMKTSGIESRKPIGEVRPGPGDYVLPSTMTAPKPARSNVMISTAKREGVSTGPIQGTTGPGPGTYSVAEPLVRKSYNILLAPEF